MQPTHARIDHTTEPTFVLEYVAPFDKAAHKELIRRQQTQHFNNADPDQSWQQAWNYCKRQQRAVTVVINGEKWTLSPMGESWKHGA